MPSVNVLLATAAAFAVAGAGVFGLTQTGSAQSTTGVGAAPSTSADVVGELAADEGIFIDGKTFKIARGKAKGDPTAQIAKLGAKEVGPGAILFRHGDKLYMAEGSPIPAPQAMKNFQDEWAVSYMNTVKNFQDTFSTMYMK